MDMMQAIRERHSVRQYKKETIPAELREKLRSFTETVNEESGLNIAIVFDDPEGFDSKLAKYGSFRNVENYIVLKGCERSDFEERCGYYGEKLVLYAQTLGLNTCWAALTFNKKQVLRLIPAGEKLSMVIALGFGETQGKPHKGKGFSDVCMCKDPSEKLKTIVDAALLAPTAVNQQKFRIDVSDDSVEASVSGFGFYTGVDLGIIKCHLDVAKKYCGGQ